MQQVTSPTQSHAHASASRACPPAASPARPPPEKYKHRSHDREKVGLIRSSEYGNPGPCLGMAWADTDNLVYQSKSTKSMAQVTRYLRRSVHLFFALPIWNCSVHTDLVDRHFDQIPGPSLRRGPLCDFLGLSFPRPGLSSRPYLEYSRANSYPWCPVSPRRACPGPGSHTLPRKAQREQVLY